MEKIKFNVSSKTARLIGRENISDSNGAVIELVKNSYDADADSVFIKFNIIFENVPDKIIISDYKKYFNKNEYEILLNYYDQSGDILTKRKDLSDSCKDCLEKLFYSKNSIIILDNGSGMNEEIIKTVWMNIGTNDKEVNTYSKKGRIKTGAKGIGRFALEKLSQRTTVYSKTKKDPLVYWNLDWLQFDEKNMLDEINADVNILESQFSDIISKFIDISEFDKNIKFDSGTLIILSGTREQWSERIYKRINNNLNSINPFGNVDIFNVYIRNSQKNIYDYNPQATFLSENDYDYIIDADFDGEKIVNIKLTRNEIDLLATKENIIINNKVYSFNINEFWKRAAFKYETYTKDDYNSIVEKKYDVYDLLPKSSENEVKKIGKFSLKFYFLKSGKSEFSIVKDIKVNHRKQLLSKFSGIKIYRDNFKVRPYGEEGPMYDWLQLGTRVQNSPAGITHPSGAWRVNTYQLIGNVNISRIDNPYLEDMANREGLALNDTYYLFVELVQNIISKFEYDRQYIYREYGAWLKKHRDEIDKSDSIKKAVIEEKENNKQNQLEYTNDEYKEAIYHVISDEKKIKDSNRIMMNFSSVGVTANTFAHEMKSVSTNIATRYQQLKICIDYIINNRKFENLGFYDPYSELEAACKNDNLLSKWLKLIMDSANKKNIVKQNILLKNFFTELQNDWNGLLEKKLINLNVENVDECYINCEKVDLYLIFNNLILNSAYFLEQDINGDERIINIKYFDNDGYVIFEFENNGPKLDNKYANDPDMIFEAGETTKENGTGLGLWICKETISRNNGEIHVVPYAAGFKIRLKIPKGD